MTSPVYLCDFRSEPGERECLEAVWSVGRACKNCPADCYRAGWDKKRVDADNAERVRRKPEGGEHEGAGEQEGLDALQDENGTPK